MSPDQQTLRDALESRARALSLPAAPGLGAVTFVPVLHDRLEHCVAVRDELCTADPAADAVAVELPETLQAVLVRAVALLPAPTALRWKEASGRDATLLVHPADAACEAARLALERGLPLACVDADVEGYPALLEPAPDATAIERVGHRAYAGAWLAWPPGARGEPELCARAAELDARRDATMAFHLAALRGRHRHVLFVCGLSHAAAVRALLAGPVARPLGRVRRDGVELRSLSQRAVEGDVLPEPPYLLAWYERARREGAAIALDRYARLRELFLAARDRLHEQDGERVAVPVLQTALVFARNLALVAGRLAPDLYDTLVAARGVSDDFAYHVWHLATELPGREPAEPLPEIDLTLEDLARDHRVIRFERRLRTRRHPLRLVRPRAREKRPGEWKERWEGWNLCSHPPEDLRIESFGALLRKQAATLISSERSRTEPFSTSLRDGIDLRETIRNLAHDGRIWVREEQPIRGKVGAIVLVFDEDRAARPEQERYRHAMTWQGEHEQESDMALYSTAPGEHLVGPGISRCEYGGLLMTYPPGRMFGVWEDPFFEHARSKPERLLLAAVDYCVERLVVYVGPRPPAARAVAHARRAGKRVLFLPLAGLSPITLRRLRTFHVLDGHDVRSYAKDYIG